MLVSASRLKWLLRFYPPLFFQRIWVVKIEHDFSGITVKVNKSILNANYNSTTFGGTIFSAADVCYPVLFHQTLTKKGYKVAVWSRSAEIHFLKKITDKVIFSVNLSAEDLKQIALNLTGQGKVTSTYPINICDSKGEICVIVKCEVYIRNLGFTKTNCEESLYE